jgi:hypothetical protein
MRRICEVGLQERDCRAPAAYGGNGGIAEGDGSCRGVCKQCGTACCASCSRRTPKGRVCNDCAGSYRTRRVQIEATP